MCIINQQSDSLDDVCITRIVKISGKDNWLARWYVSVTISIQGTTSQVITTVTSSITLHSYAQSRAWFTRGYTIRFHVSTLEGFTCSQCKTIHFQIRY